MNSTPTLMQRSTHPIAERLEDGLVLRSVRDEADIARCAAFVSVNMRKVSGITTERLLHHFPNFGLDDFLFVEDERTSEVVSTTCLLPWQCRFDEVVLNVAMLEVVATHPEYRKRGLVRAGIGAFHRAVAEQNFDLSLIEGIPYYYRQFGYAYATDHAASDMLPSSSVPERAASLSPIHLRRATPEDIPALMHFYDATFSALNLTTLRSAEIWHYVLTAAEHPLYMIEEAVSHTPVGYLSAWLLENQQGIRIAQSGIPSAETALEVLRLCKQTTSGEIQIDWPQESPLVQVSRSLGSVVTTGDQWLMRVTNPQSFLSKLAPLFERRLLHSAYTGYTGDLIINLFRQAYLLRFVAGRLLEVNALGFVDASMGANGGDLCIPPDAFVRWILGYRSLDQLLDAWPDIVIRPASRFLLGTLFPVSCAYFSMPYFYTGEREAAFDE